MFWGIFQKPIAGEVFNIGGGRKNSCSIVEVIELMKKKDNSKSKITFIKKIELEITFGGLLTIQNFKILPNWKIRESLDNIIKKIVQK